MRAMRCLLVAVLFASGCGNAAAPMDLGPTNALVAARPYDTNIPQSYDPSKPTPLVIMLHGYSATPFVEEAIYKLTPVSESRGFLYAMPEGLIDSMHHPYWNATDACCDMDGSHVDDVAYLNAVIDDMEARYNVDKKRVFFTGHSNGGFMSHRMACDAAPRIAAIVSLAGAVWLDPTKCQPADKVAVLEVHGDADLEVPYQGAALIPSAPQTVATWADKNGCAAALTDTGMTLDLDVALGNPDTKIERHDGCPASAAAELWTIMGEGHVPNFNQPTWPTSIYDWMEAHAKP